MGHRSSFRPRGGITESQRRKKSWFSVQPPSDIFGFSLLPPDIAFAGSTLALAIADGLGTPTLIESTLLRIRGAVEVPKSIVGTGGNSDIFAFGIGYVTNEAALAGAVPNPATASGADWDGWIFLRTSGQAALDITGTVMDSKAMRKWKSGTSLVFVAGLATDQIVGTIGQPFEVQARLLFMLP